APVAFRGSTAVSWSWASLFRLHHDHVLLPAARARVLASPLLPAPLPDPPRPAGGPAPRCRGHLPGRPPRHHPPAPLHSPRPRPAPPRPQAADPYPPAPPLHSLVQPASLAEVLWFAQHLHATGEAPRAASLLVALARSLRKPEGTLAAIWLLEVALCWSDQAPF